MEQYIQNIESFSTTAESEFIATTPGYHSHDIIVIFVNILSTTDLIICSYCSNQVHHFSTASPQFIWSQ